MTRPIYEPSLQRTDARLGYGQNQLFRRPSPQGSLGDIPWMRVKQIEGGQLFPATDESLVLWDDVCNPYPDYFDVINADTFPQFTMKIPGLYQVTCRIDVDVAGALSFPADGFEIGFVNIDYDTWLYYPTYVSGSAHNSTDSGYAELTFRGGPTHTVPGQFIEVKVLTFADPLTIEQGGSYCEFRFLGGDPYWPLGLLNDTVECS